MLQLYIYSGKLYYQESVIINKNWFRKQYGYDIINWLLIYYSILFTTVFQDKNFKSWYFL